MPSRTLILPPVFIVIKLYLITQLQTVYLIIKCTLSVFYMQSFICELSHFCSLLYSHQLNYPDSAMCSWIDQCLILFWFLPSHWYTLEDAPFALEVTLVQTRQNEIRSLFFIQGLSALLSFWCLQSILGMYISPFRNIWLCFIVYSDLAFHSSLLWIPQEQSAVCHQNGRLKAAALSLLGKNPLPSQRLCVMPFIVH